MENPRFNLKAALNGNPVMIDGDKCTFIGFRMNNGDHPLCFEAECGDRYFVTLDGESVGREIYMAEV